MNQKVSKFIARIAAMKNFSDVNNFYATNPTTKTNLTIYLHEMIKRKPESLFVGEAPGFQGCRQTGLPFTSEWIIQHGESVHPLFKAGFTALGLQKEPTATIVWEEIRKCKLLPLLWNSFPLHPHEKGKPDTNRKPRVAELEWGKEVLLELIKLFPTIRMVVAIGNKAHEQLLKCSLSYPIEKVRHPANGGKPLFVEGLQACNF